MRAVVMAYGNIGCAGLNALLGGGVDVAAVFTHADDPAETIWFASVAETAARRGISVFAPEDVNHPLWVERIRAMEPDCVFSFYYRNMLSEALLRIPKIGAFNLHGSLLPRYRGRCPVNWVLINGETETGLTLHYMTARADAGDIVGQVAIPVDRNDTARTLSDKMAALTPDFLAPLLPAIASGRPPRVPQDDAAASYYGGRRPKDGVVDWSASAERIRNLVRAVTKPFPGAFTHLAGRKVYIWRGEVDTAAEPERPGTVLSADPLRVACGEGAFRIDSGQVEGGVEVDGRQLADILKLTPGMRFANTPPRAAKKTRVLILGVNGFIGNALSERLLGEGGYEVVGMDRNDDQIARFNGRPGFHFIGGDITIHRETMRYEISRADVVLPLVAIATPIEYVRNPLRVFELDFEENLRVIRYCVEYGKRVVFPSTSEVYGMCDDPEFDEDNSPLVVGPIRNQRWIYSASKQLLDRVIWAYGQRGELRFTLFRPFNWIGPRLDRLDSARIGSSRAITQMILNLVEGTPILLIDGGSQKRCFTAVDDGIEGLYRIIANKGENCDGQILNLGNPDGELSIRRLGEILVDAFERHPLRDRFPRFAGFREMEGAAYYGKGYQDVLNRKPSIAKAGRLLGWKPAIDPGVAVEGTLDYFLRDYVESLTENGTKTENRLCTMPRTES